LEEEVGDESRGHAQGHVFAFHVPRGRRYHLVDVGSQFPQAAVEYSPDGEVVRSGELDQGSVALAGEGERSLDLSDFFVGQLF
jgi:hypothetical protein